MSTTFQADNDLNSAIVSAVRRREPSIDFASAGSADFDSVGDAEVLERAAQSGRVLVSHDRRTMLRHFRQRIEAGQSSPGLLVVSQGAPVGGVAEAIVTVWATATAEDLRNRAYHLPSLAEHRFTR